jgi:hypothetical protein
MDGAILYLQYIRPLDRTLYGLQGYFFQGVIQTNKQKTRRQDVRYKAKHGAKKNGTNSSEMSLCAGEIPPY